SSSASTAATSVNGTGEPALEPLRPGEVDRIYTTGDRASAVLGWVPEMNLREGLRRTAEHIRAHG
ncbi:MAG TPA: hypothetical protein PKL84_16450, partial [Candidatus Hydrogenedentes bacterium]|nr:hypothetical protein [Candidatus Hydrogenedentota bacterium]